jgi:hypothetical protein
MESFISGEQMLLFYSLCQNWLEENIKKRLMSQYIFIINQLNPSNSIDKRYFAGLL